MSISYRFFWFALVLLGFTGTMFGRGGTIFLTPTDARFVDVWLDQNPKSADVGVLLLLRKSLPPSDEIKWVRLHLHDNASEMTFYLAPDPEKPEYFPTINSQKMIDALRSEQTATYSFAIPRRLFETAELHLSTSRPTAPNILTFKIRLKDWVP